MKTLTERIQKLRNGKGWYVSYPMAGIGDTYAHNSRIGTVIFRLHDDTMALTMACDFCERQNKKLEEGK